MLNTLHPRRSGCACHMCCSDSVRGVFVVMWLWDVCACVFCWTDALRLCTVRICLYSPLLRHVWGTDTVIKTGQSRMFVKPTTERFFRNTLMYVVFSSHVKVCRLWQTHRQSFSLCGSSVTLQLWKEEHSFSIYSLDVHVPFCFKVITTIIEHLF